MFDREFIRNVIAADDRARDDFEIFQRRRATQQPRRKQGNDDMMEPESGESREEFLDRCVAEGNDSEDCALWWEENRAAPKAQTAVMAPEIQRGWDAWLKAHFDAYTEKSIRPLAEEIAEVTVQIEGQADLLRKKVEGLMHEVHALRAEIAAMRDEQRSGGDVVHHLPNWRRDNAAA